MKTLEQVGALLKMGTSMVNEAKESNNMKKTKANLKDDINKLKNSEVPTNLAKNLFAAHKARKEMIKGILDSDEVNFIKTAVKESEKGKKVAETLDSIGDMIPFPIKREFVNYKYWLINQKTLIDFTLSVPPKTLIMPIVISPEVAFFCCGRLNKAFEKIIVSGRASCSECV